MSLACMGQGALCCVLCLRLVSRGERRRVDPRPCIGCLPTAECGNGTDAVFACCAVPARPPSAADMTCCRLERQLRSKVASLPAEPPADDAEAVNLMVGCGLYCCAFPMNVLMGLPIIRVCSASGGIALCLDAIWPIQQAGAAPNGSPLCPHTLLHVHTRCLPSLSLCRCACRQAAATPAASAARTRCRCGCMAWQRPRSWLFHGTCFVRCFCCSDWIGEGCKCGRDYKEQGEAARLKPWPGHKWWTSKAADVTVFSSCAAHSWFLAPPLAQTVLVS